MTSISITRELPEEFLSDTLITAFDGHYGSSWQWFEPSSGPNGDKFWLLTKNDSGHTSSDNPWMRVRIKLREEYRDEASIPSVYTGQELLIDHEDLAKAISRILNDDYIGVWREPSEREKEDYLGGNHYCREFRERCRCGHLDVFHGSTSKWCSHCGCTSYQPTMEVHTGETARGLRASLSCTIHNVTSGESDEVDAELADAIVQVAAFGKVVFS